MITNSLPIDVKICGLSTPSAVKTAIEGGANHIGFIFFEKSPRNVSLDLAASLASECPASVNTVAVCVNADESFIQTMVDVVKPDFVQFHGQETPQQIADFKQKFGIKAIKALPIKTYEDFAGADPYFDYADRLLFDAKPPADATLPGGNGASFDWKLLAKWRAEIRNRSCQGSGHPANPNHLDMATSAMLSGGLKLSNIAEALQHSHAQGIDLSSGVERSPGIKDDAKIAALLEAIAVLCAQADDAGDRFDGADQADD